MTLETYLKEVKERCSKTSYLNLDGLPDHTRGFKLVVCPTRGFELAVNLTKSQVLNMNQNTKDVTALVEIVEEMKGALDYIKDSRRLECLKKGCQCLSDVAYLHLFNCESLIPTKEGSDGKLR